MAVTLEAKTPYKNVFSCGEVRDEKGRGMHKSLGNVIWFDEAADKMGTDVMRWMYTTQNPAFNLNFGYKFGKEIAKKLIILWNAYLFFETYAEKGQRVEPKVQSNHVLDRWIASRLNELIQQVTENLDKYNVTFAARAIENFVINDLSQWYIRRSRRRFQKSETPQELKEASTTLNHILLTLSKLTAPFIPFFSEYIYQQLMRSACPVGSRRLSFGVHLENWPKVNKKLINKKLNQEMEKTREVVKLALAERARFRIKVRQPLNELRIKNYELRKEKELLELIKDEVNVKKITFGKSIKLDTKITPELKEEGIIREVIRQIQEMRKKAGLKPRHRILVRYSGPSNLNKILARNKSLILEETKAKDFQLGKRTKRVFGIEKEKKVDSQKLWLAIRKF
jgi:isoleucyl-tRNA synthetase